MQEKLNKGKLVLIRHGQSQWNLDNRFTGWVDVDLTDLGIIQAQEAGKILQKCNIDFDIAYTSVLKRAIKTLWHVLDTLDLSWIPVTNAWQFNERHYGSLTGLNKKHTEDKYGAEQVKIWRRSYEISPPDIALDSPYHAANDRRYKNLDPSQIPHTECLKDTLERVVKYWLDSNIQQHINNGKNIIISAHGNSLRALIKHLSCISKEKILELELANAQPILYDFNHTTDSLNKNGGLIYQVLS